MFDIFLIALLAMLSSAGIAANSYAASPAVSDTSTVADTALQQQTGKKKTRSDIDSVIYAKSNDSLFFFVKGKKMSLYGGGDLHYKETNLKSGDIQVNFITKNIDAAGKYKDSAGTKILESPVLMDKGEEYRGSNMRYNFKTSRGLITFAQTKNKGEESAYSGAIINKVDKKTFFVQDGIYTTCDEKDPHYCFVGAEMKVIQKEQMVGKWVWLAFGGVPFPIPIPFVVVPLQSGRRSGIIPPAYGDRAGYGKYFSHFGYFWAINDYTDLALTGDYYTKGGFASQTRYRYVSRYNYSGYFEGSFSNLTSGESSDSDRTQQKNYHLRLVHNQTITPTSRFDANLEFMTSDYFQQNASSYNQLLTNEIYSNASYFKSWEEAGTSLGINYSRRQELESGKINEVLPTITFGKSQFYPFKSSKFTGSEKWYELVGVNYNSQLQNQRNKEQGQLSIRGGIQHSFGIGVSPKLGYINFSPTFNYRELWYNKRVVKKSVINPDSSETLVTDDMHQINFVRTFSMGVGASTKVYGIVQPQTAGIAAVRHILTPTITFNYNPDFSKPGWKYYDEYTKKDGSKVKYSKFEREIFGGASSGESRSLGFNLDNVFDMKTMVDPRDTLSKESKVQLLNLSGDVSYDFTKDSLKFSDVRLNYRTQIGSFNLSGGSNYSLYNYDEKGTTINQYLINKKRGLMRMTNFNFSCSFQLAADKSQSPVGPDQQQPPLQNEAPVDTVFSNSNRNYKGIFDREQVDFSIPWDLSLNYNYNLSKSSPFVSSISSTVNGSFNFNLTPKWKFSMSGSYDIRNKQFSAPQIIVTRDLHCWTMNFTWNPIGTYTGYRFEIRVKASQLQDLKVTKTENLFSGR